MHQSFERFEIAYIFPVMSSEQHASEPGNSPAKNNDQQFSPDITFQAILFDFLYLVDLTN